MASWFDKLFARSSKSPQRPAKETRPPATRSDNNRQCGFDPYNSGSFERKNAWERVNRR